MDENRRFFPPNFRRVFRPGRRNSSPEFRSWGFSDNILGSSSQFSKDFNRRPGPTARKGWRKNQTGSGKGAAELFSPEPRAELKPFFVRLQKSRERGNRAFLRLRNAFKYSVLEASKLVSTKTLLLKHYYRRQGKVLWIFCFVFAWGFGIEK